MTEQLSVGTGTIAYDVSGEGPLVVLSHGIGVNRNAYRFVAPALVAAGYRVAVADLRGCGESSTGWDGYSRTDIAGDLVVLIRHLGGPAVIVGHSISGGAATIAAATAPGDVTGLIELAPFTRAQSIDLGGMVRVRRYRVGGLRLLRAGLFGSLTAWTKYLDLAIPVKPADWDEELAGIRAMLGQPERMKALRAMGQANPKDAGEALGGVRCPVLVVEGTLDPDWPDPRAEGERILAELPPGLGELAVIDGAGHYPHEQVPDQVVALALPFLARTASRA